MIGWLVFGAVVCAVLIFFACRTNYRVSRNEYADDFQQWFEEFKRGA